MSKPTAPVIATNYFHNNETVDRQKALTQLVADRIKIGGSAGLSNRTLKNERR